MSWIFKSHTHTLLKNLIRSLLWHWVMKRQVFFFLSFTFLEIDDFSSSTNRHARRRKFRHSRGYLFTSSSSTIINSIGTDIDRWRYGPLFLYHWRSPNYFRRFDELRFVKTRFGIFVVSNIVCRPIRESWEAIRKTFIPPLNTFKVKFRFGSCVSFRECDILFNDYDWQQFYRILRARNGNLNSGSDLCDFISLRWRVTLESWHKSDLDCFFFFHPSERTPWDCDAEILDVFKFIRIEVRHDTRYWLMYWY